MLAAACISRFEGICHICWCRPPRRLLSLHVITYPLGRHGLVLRALHFRCEPGRNGHTPHGYLLLYLSLGDFCGCGSLASTWSCYLTRMCVLAAIVQPSPVWSGSKGVLALLGVHLVCWELGCCSGCCWGRILGLGWGKCCSHKALGMGLLIKLCHLSQLQYEHPAAAVTHSVRRQCFT